VPVRRGGRRPSVFTPAPREESVSPLISCWFRNPTAVILQTEDVGDFKPAPVVASFSARGPGLTESILKVVSFPPQDTFWCGRDTDMLPVGGRM
jgi:hypothetical protein